MRLAGEDQLHRPALIRQQLPRALEVFEDQARALVGREPSREPDRERVRVEQRPRADDVRRLLPLPSPSPARLLSNESHEDRFIR